MINTTLTLFTMLIGFLTFAQNQENLLVKINGEEIKADYDEEFKYTTAEGEELNIVITQSEFLTYIDDMISFQYANDLSISSSQVKEGIEMLIVRNSSRSGIMIQKYQTIDPSGLNHLMLDEITKESLNYGYTKSEKKFTKKLKNGKVLEGIQATLTYNGEEEVYIVASYGEKDKGILVITMLFNDELRSDDGLIDLFFDTLEIK